MRPIIGITTSFSQAIYVTEYKEPRQEHQYLYHSYVKAIWAAGGNPVLIPVGIEPHAGVEALRRIDGLLLPGDVDIDPDVYKHPPCPNQTRIDQFKDETELAIVQEALKRMMPIFGICRGIQVIAVVNKKSPIQDIGTEIPWALKHNNQDGDLNALHEVNLREGSVLRSIFGTEKISVNSWHHQAVGEIPAGWKISAETSDGVVEAIEHSSDPLIFAVQWHPEAMLDSDPSQLKLFKAFVNSCLQ